MALASPQVDRIIPRIAGFFFATVILIYLGLIGVANWAVDEYDDFGRLAHDGWKAVWIRLQWSPRPISEALFLAYGWTVNHARRPLIVPFLGLLWVGLLVAGLLTYWQDRRVRYREDEQTESTSFELLACLALLASFVSGGSIMEVFYWPAGAAECLTTLAATLLFFLQTARGRLTTPGGRHLGCFCLLAAAGSSEVGAAFVLSYAAVQVLQHVMAGIRPSSPGRQDPVVWWIVPSGLAALVLAALQFTRLSAVERPVSQLSPALGNPMVSLAIGLREMLLELLGVHLRAHGLAVSGRLVAQVLLAIGFALCWARFMSPSRTVARQTAALSAAFVLASLLSIVGAELHFGAVCCQRHEILRRCWMLMALAGLAVASLTWTAAQRLVGRLSPALAPILLCAGILAAWHSKPVLREYRNYGALSYAIDHNFRSGFDAANSQMTFLLRPPGGLIYQEQVAPGIYLRDRPSPPYVLYVLRFFDKQSMVVHSASEWMSRRESESQP
jgi:hypothetical protein